MRFMKAALAAAAAATVAIAILLRARRLRAKKIAYINTEDAPKWHDQLEVFASALRLPPEVFEKFDAFADQFPSAAALQRGEYSGVLITGSHFSAVDPTLPWLDGLFASIRAAAMRFRGPTTLEPSNPRCVEPAAPRNRRRGRNGWWN